MYEQKFACKVQMCERCYERVNLTMAVFAIMSKNLLARCDVRSGAAKKIADN